MTSSSREKPARNRHKTTVQYMVVSLFLYAPPCILANEHRESVKITSNIDLGWLTLSDRLRSFIEPIVTTPKINDIERYAIPKGRLSHMQDQTNQGKQFIAFT